MAIQQKGTGPNKDKQESPHAHSVWVDPSKQWVLCCDLGADRIFIYKNQKGTLIQCIDQ